MRPGRAMRMATGVICVALVVGCTSSSDDDDDEDTAVAGAVLERDDDGEPAAPDDPDEERVDPRDDAEEGDETEDPDDASADEPEDASDENTSEDATDPDTSDDATGDDATHDGDVAASEGSSNGERGRAPAAPPARPSPEPLATGVGLVGDVVGFGTDGAEVLIGGAVDAPPVAGARSDAFRVGGGYEIGCRTSLQAPQQRGLIARGDLSVDLLLGYHDGSERRVALQIMDLDVELEAGEHFELPTSGGWAVDPAEVGSIACEPRFDRG